QNRITKYSRDGKLLMVIDRKLDYEESTRYSMEMQKIPQGKDEDGNDIFDEVRISVSNFFTRGVQLDSNDRIWTITNKRQPDRSKIAGVQTDIFMFEIFDRNGVLLCNLDTPDIYFDVFKIIGGSLIIYNINDQYLYEYRIIEK
ncbi:hypothetical protein ACFL7D_09020, partial [candidate division KSB1 bacterium]